MALYPEFEGIIWKKGKISDIEMFFALNECLEVNSWREVSIFSSYERKD